MSRWSYLVSCPDNFEDFADVVFVIGNERMPAHSQYLAGQSKLMQNLMREASAFSKDRPLVLDHQLQSFAIEDLRTFLNHVYVSSAIGSASEAYALIKVADMFDATKLMTKAITYLEKESDDLLVSKESIVRWLLLAERFALASFMTKCANQAALMYSEVKTDAQFNELGPSALKAVMEGLHLLMDVHPGIRLSSHHGGSSTDKLSAQDFAAISSLQIPASTMHVKQVYMCKCTFACTLDIGMNPPSAHGACCGHLGSWTWNLQKHMWQLDSNPGITTKVVPRDVLELANLLGSLPIHRLEESMYKRVSIWDDQSPAKPMHW